MEEKIFSTDIGKYKAIAYFEVSMDFESNDRQKVEFNESYGFHVSVLQEEEGGDYYAICLELNQVSVGNSVKQAIMRMQDLLASVSEKALLDEDWNFIYDYMDDEYFTIFHKLKEKHNQLKAKKLTDFLRNQRINSDFVIEVIEEKKHQICTKLGKAFVEKIYDIEIGDDRGNAA